MKKLLCVFILGIAFLGISSVAQADNFKLNDIGVRGGLGMDTSGGFAYGAGANYQFGIGNDTLEMGLNLYANSFKETTSSGGNTYNETTNLFVFGVLANYLFNYKPNQPGVFVLAGIGLAAISVDWTEESPDDTSLGTPWGSGSKQSRSAGAAGSIFNLGIGTVLENGLDLRLEVPTILVFSAPGKAASVVPTITLTVGSRFQL